MQQLLCAAGLHGMPRASRFQLPHPRWAIYDPEVGLTPLAVDTCCNPAWSGHVLVQYTPADSEGYPQEATKLGMLWLRRLTVYLLITDISGQCHWLPNRMLVPANADQTKGIV